MHLKSSVAASLLLTASHLSGCLASLDRDLSQDESNRSLSRHRRFVYPTSTGWVLSFLFTLVIPVQGELTGSLSITVPFTYTVDSGT